MQPDFYVEHHGSIVLLRPTTAQAFEWEREHLPSDRMHYGNAVVVEPRYIEDIVDGIVGDGLTVQEG